MNALWVLLSCVLGAAVSGSMVFLAMRSRAEVLLARQREEIAEARASLAAQKEAMTDTLKTVEESARRHAMDEFLADIRIEERHYVREHKLLFVNKKSMVLRERVLFRNIPLSSWVEQEMPIEEGTDVESLAKTLAIFSPESLLGAPVGPPRKLLR